MSVYTFTVGSITWRYTLDASNNASIGNGTGDTGNATTLGGNLSGAIIIPSALNGYTVTKIGGSAFINCTNLTSVVIPNSVVTIGGAFSNCTGLTSVTIPNSVVTIEAGAFNLCRVLTSVTIPNSVVTIGNSAFNGCRGLTSVTFGNSVVSIGTSAFRACEALITLTIPNSVTFIGTSAFNECGALTSATLSNSIVSIEMSTFHNCGNLRSITIPSLVKSIGETAFNNCPSLRRIKIPDSVTSIGTYTFQGTPSNLFVLMNTKTISGTLYTSPTTTDRAFFGNDSVTLRLPTPVMTITSTTAGVTSGSTTTNSTIELTFTSSEATTIFGEEDIFVTRGSLTNFAGSGSVYTAIFTPSGPGACAIRVGVDNLNANSKFDADSNTFTFTFDNDPPTMTIPSTLYTFTVGSITWNYSLDESNNASIGTGDFYQSGNATTLGTGLSGAIIIPSSLNGYPVTNIGDFAFIRCPSLTSVTIPASVTSIGRQGFRGCTGLTSFAIPNTVNFIGIDAFRSCSGLTSVTISNSITSINERVFNQCTGLTSVTLGNSVVTIGLDAFRSCIRLRSLTIPNSVTSIGSGAFYDCALLTSVTNGNSLTIIRTEAFYGCTVLSSINIPASVTTIEGSAFYGTSAYLVVSMDTKTISENTYTSPTTNNIAFFGNPSVQLIKTIYTFTVGSITWRYQLDASNNASIGTGTGETGSATTLGGNLSGAIIIPSALNGYTVTKIGGSAFVNCTNLTSAVIPESVVTIDGSAFGNCTGITSVTIPNSVVTIEAGAFGSCRVLTSVTIPNSVVSIGFGAFRDCRVLTSVTFGNSLVSIGPWAFLDCIALRTITIPNSVTSIGYTAFKACGALTSATLSNSIVIIESSTFQDCGNLTSITIPSLVKRIEETAFGNCPRLERIKIPDSVTSIAGNYVFFLTPSNLVVEMNTHIINGTLYTSPSTNDISFFGNDSVTLVLPLYTFTVGSITWNYTLDASNNAIIGTGANDNGNATTLGVGLSGAITIPSVLNGYTVTGIGRRAFVNCSSLTSVTIPNSLVTIGDLAFENCTLLARIKIPDSVTSIAGSTFQGTSSNLFALMNTRTIGGTTYTSPTTNDIAFFGNSSVTLRLPTPVMTITSTTAGVTSGSTTTNATIELTFTSSNAISNFVAGDIIVTRGSLTNFAGSGSVYTGTVTPSGPGVCTIRVGESYFGADSKFDVGSNTFTFTFDSDPPTMTIASPVYSFTVGSITWRYSLDASNNATIGTGDFYQSGNATTSRGGLSGAIIIPSELNSYPVASISEFAFINCLRLTSVTIPASVTSIGLQAFRGCTGLTSFTIPNTVNFIGIEAFRSCSGLTSVTLGNSVTSINPGLFNQCTFLTSVTVGNSVTSIGLDAFRSCIRLTSVTIPNSVTSIGSGAFFDCALLASVIIGNSVTSIDIQAFYGCTVLSSINIPPSVTTIDGYAFYGTSANLIASLDTKTISGNTYTSPTTNDIAFFGNPSVTLVKPIYTFTVGSITWNYSLDASNNATIGTGDFANGNATTLGTNLIGAIITPSVLNGYAVTVIGRNAFKNCTGITSVVIPDSVIIIGEAAFRETVLTSVTIPNSVVTIGVNAFNRCSVLTSVTIGNSVVNIGFAAFELCRVLTSLTIPNSVVTIGEAAFYQCDQLTSVTLSNSLVNIGNSVFYNCTKLTSITIPDSVKTIPNDAFTNCTLLARIKIPDSVTSIASNSFNNTSTNLFVLMNTKTIGGTTYTSPTTTDRAFFGNSSVTLRLPTPVMTITSTTAGVTSGSTTTNSTIELTFTSSEATTIFGEGDIFVTRGSLTNFAGSDSVYTATFSPSGPGACTIRVGEDNFNANSKFDADSNTFTFTFDSDPPTMTIPSTLYTFTVGSITWNYSLDESNNASIGTGDFYQSGNATTLGIDLSGAIIIPSALNGYPVTNIGEFAFIRCPGLTSVTIPTSVTSIGLQAFRGCTGLTSFTIPNTVNFIGIEAFRSCSGLTSVTISNSVTSINQGVFNQCTGLTSVTLGNSVVTIGLDAFRSCRGLISVTIPNSVTSIGSGAFFECVLLASVTIGNSVTSIGIQAFYGCTGLTYISIPASVTTIDGYAFYGTSANLAVSMETQTISENTYTSPTTTDIAFFGNPSVTLIKTVYTFTVGSITWNYSLDESNNASIGTGAEANGNATTLAAQLTGAIIIPSVLNGYTVTGISRYAFINCTNLTSVVIPDSVIIIGEHAFNFCFRITSLTIGNSVRSFDIQAFTYCEGLTSVTIPASVTSIGNFAFFGCSRLTSLKIPDSVVSIGGNAFSGTSSNLVVEMNTKTIAGTTYTSPTSNDIAFFGNSSVTLIVPVPNVYTFTVGSITWRYTIDASNNASIGTGSANQPYGNATTSGTNLSGAIIIPSVLNGYTVTTIGNYAFMDCINLTSVVIPDSVTIIGEMAFIRCWFVTSLTIGNSVVRLRDYAFSELIRLTSVTIPNSVTTLGYGAFNACILLTSVTLGNSVKTIGTQAFRDCEKLTYITIPNSVTSIDYQAFINCTRLVRVKIPDSVTSIQDSFRNTSPNLVVEINNNRIISGTTYTSPTTNDISFFGNDSVTLRLPTPTMTITSTTDGVTNGSTTTNATIELTFTSSNVVSNFGAGDIFVTRGSVTNFAGSGSVYTATFTPSGPGVCIIRVGEDYFNADSKFHVDSNIFTFTFDSDPPTMTIPSTVYTFTVGSITWNYSLDESNNASIGTGDFFQSGNATTSGGGLSGAIIIPSALNGYPVTIIGEFAFIRCSSLTSVTIPASVTSIGLQAFRGCTGLTSFTIPNTVNFIGIEAFRSCSGLTSVTISNSVTSINQGVFNQCTGLTSVTIGNSVVTIGLDAFRSCRGLTSVTIPNSVTSIGSGAFFDCTLLVSVIIGNSVTSIGIQAFFDCTNLRFINIPPSVTTIDAYAFYRTSGGLAVTMDTKTIGGTTYTSPTTNDIAFFGNPSVTLLKTLYTFTVGSITWNYTLDASNNATVGSGSSNQPYGNATTSGTNLSGAIIIPSALNGYTVTTIGNYAFMDCINLTSVVIPDSVTIIGEMAFIRCWFVTSLTIGNSVVRLRDYAFSELIRLTSVTIPNSVTTLGYGAFNACILLTSVTLGNSVKTIGTQAFRDCEKLTSITIPNSVTSIDYQAFINCTRLTSIKIPDSVRSIQDSFRNTSSNLVVEINNNRIISGTTYTSPTTNDISFFGNDSVTLILPLPEVYTFTVGSITWRYTLDASNNATIGTDGYALGGSATTVGGAGPSGALIIPSALNGYTVTVINAQSFVNCRDLTSVVIPDSVTTIVQQAFIGCSGLTSLTFGNSVVTIGGSAFGGCTSLTSVTFPNSVRSIGYQSFYGCGALTTVTLGDSVTTIGFGAFERSGITSITIPNTMTFISSDTFRQSNLVRIKLPTSVTGIDGSAFRDTPANLVVEMNTQTISGTLYTSPTTNDIDFFGNPSVTLVIPPPTMTITSTTSGVTTGSTTNNASIALTFTSSTSLSDFVVGDITLTNGQLTDFAGSGSVYTATFTPTGQGACTIKGSATKFAANSNTFNWTFDTVSPSMAITSTTAGVTSGSTTNNATIAFTFTATEAITGFQAVDISFNRGTLTAFDGSGSVYTAIFTSAGQGAYTINVPVGAYADAAGNSNTDATTFNWTFDSVSPSMTITSTIANNAPSNNASIPLTFTASKAITGFQAEDISFNRGTLTAFDGSGSVYTATFTQAGQGAYTINVPVGAYTDAVGNSNTAATTFNWTYDSVSPSMTITSTTVPNNATTNNKFIELTFTSTGSTNDFVVGDISVTNGALSNFAGIGTDGAVYTATFTPENEGTCTINVAAGVYTDLATNLNNLAPQFIWTYSKGWNTDTTANHIIKSYVKDFIDVSGSVILRENSNLYVNGNVETAGNLSLNQLVVTADASFNRRIFVGGDVSMNGAVTVSGDLFMNGTVTKCSFNNSSIPKSAFVGVVPDGSNYNTSKIVYDQTFQANDDVSMNGLIVAANNVKVSGNILFGDGTVMNTYDNNILSTNPTVFKSSTFTSLDICGNLVAGSYATSSDYRIKTNVVELDETYTVDKLRPVKYYQTQINREKYGLIAHELQEHYPDLVVGEKDGSELQRVNYTGLIAILINEIKRMKRDLAELESGI